MALAIFAAGAGLPAIAVADEFDNLDGATLTALLKDPATTPRARLTLPELGSLPRVLRGPRSALIVATTDQGNPCRLLLSAGLRKPPGAKGEALPVLVVERFDTFEAGNLKNRLARGRDLLLFDGFRLDLDFGQVVPDGQGGDLQFLAAGESGPRLLPLGGSKLAAPSKLPKADAGAPSRPSTGRTVLPSDFAGRYRLFANGQWSGTLDLKVEPKGVVSGQFRSDQSGTAYPVKGQVSTTTPNQVQFAVELPRTRQDYEGLLWVEGKGAIAGTTTLLDRPFGFFALREGGTFAPEGEEVGPTPETPAPPGRLTVFLQPGGMSTLDGKALDTPRLVEALKAAVAAEPATSVLLRIPAAIPFSEVHSAIEAARNAAVPVIRLAPDDPKE